jgi:hypothetical protein
MTQTDHLGNIQLKVCEIKEEEVSNEEVLFAWFDFNHCTEWVCCTSERSGDIIRGGGIPIGNCLQISHLRLLWQLE